MIPHSKPDISEADRQAVQDVLASGMVNEGELASRLERWFAERFGAATAVAVGSGSQALGLALRTLRLPRGAEIIVPDYVCVEVLAVIEDLDLTPVVVDIDDDYLLSLEAARAAVTARTGAVVYPYVLGLYRDPRQLRSLGLPVIEDCALFFPAGFAGTWPLLGELAIFSFEGTKLVTSGEGGVVLTRDAGFAERLRAAKRYRNTPYKLNLYPFSDIQAGLALSQLGRIDYFANQRRQLAERYVAALDGIEGLVVPRATLDRSVYFRLPLRVDADGPAVVNALIDAFASEGVAVRRPVAELLSRVGARRASTPNASRLIDITFSLPLYPALTRAEQDKVIAVAKELLPVCLARRG